MSDRQKGLVPALGELLPRVEQRHCVRHIHANMKLKFPGEAVKDILWKCAKATYSNKFEVELQALKDYDSEAHAWLLQSTCPKHWSRSKFIPAVKYDVLLNNHSESFNKQLINARCKPILGLLERVRVYLMLRCQSRREWVKKQKGIICPRIMKKLEKLKKESAMCYPSYVGRTKFQVREALMEQFSVDTGVRSCSCRKWDISGIPCKHGIAAIGLEGKKPEDFVDRVYSLYAYMAAYTPIIGPCNGPNNWPRSTFDPVVPPKKMKLPGRPKMKRKLEHGEKPNKHSKNGPTKLGKKGVTVMKCTKCWKGGHNARKCPQKDGASRSFFEYVQQL